MNKHKFIDTTWHKITYDVWGNEKEGFEVNQSYHSGDADIRLRVEIANVGTPQAFASAYPTDKQLRDALDIKPRFQIDKEGDSETIYVYHRSSRYPYGELQLTSHASLSPIREHMPKVCVLCKSHYGDNEPCDEGKPVNSPHRQEFPATKFGAFARKYCERQDNTFQGLFDVLQDKIKNFNPIGFVMVECKDMSSSRLGELVILPYGGSATLQSIPTGLISPRGLSSDMSRVVETILVEEVKI